MGGFCIPGGAGGGTPPAGGGSPTGGGSATGGGSGPGGGSGGCVPLTLGTTSFPGGGFTALDDGYNTFGGGYNFATFATTSQVLSFELVRVTGASVPVPYSGSFMPVNYDSCVGCLSFGESCTVTPPPNPTFACARRFLAQSGTVSYPQATPSTTSGTFSGTVSNVIFRQWDFGSDAQVPSGACYTLSSASFTATWP